MIVHRIGNFIHALIVERCNTATAIILLRPIAYPVSCAEFTLAAAVVESVVIYFSYHLVL